MHVLTVYRLLLQVESGYMKHLLTVCPFLQLDSGYLYRVNVRLLLQLESGYLKHVLTTWLLFQLESGYLKHLIC